MNSLQTAMFRARSASFVRPMVEREDTENKNSAEILALRQRVTALEAKVTKLIAAHTKPKIELIEEPLEITRYPTIEEIIKSVCELFEIRKLDLKSERRTHNLCLPRQIVCYLCKRMTLRSYPQIGRQLGNRDHSTIFHAYNKINELRQTDGILRAQLDELERRILLKCGNPSTGCP